MFDLLFLFLYCKDTIKSNNRQIFKGKSYYLVYYLTFINNKIKDYYIITYFLVLFMLLYVISLYYIYTLLYIKKEQKQAEGKEERTRAKDAAAIFASSSPLFCSVCCLHRPHHLQPLTPHHVAPSPNEMAATSSASGRCYRHNVATPRRRSTNNQQQGSASTVCHLARLVLFPVQSFRW